MTLVCLLLVLASLCFLMYRWSGKDPISPPFLFSLGFAACALFTLLFSERWQYSMSGTVFLVVGGSVLVFCLVSYVMSLPGRHEETRAGQKEADWLLPNHRGALVAFVLLEAAVLVWSVYQISVSFPASSIAGSIGRFNSVVKFTDAGANVYGFPLKQLVSASGVLGYVFGLLLAQALVFKKADPLLCLIGLMLAASIEVVNASRTMAVGFFFSTAIAYLLLRRIRDGRFPEIRMRTVACIAILLAVFLATFPLVAQVVQGRITSSDHTTYMSAYIGAQIPNLDTFIQSGMHEAKRSIWGYMTFRNSIRWVGMHFGIPEFVYQYDLPFNQINGYATGNVYTTFYAFIYDFGYLGCFVLTVLMAAISWLVYRQARKADGGPFHSMWIIIYSIVAYALLLSFFSNKFYEGFFCIPMLNRLLYLFAIYCVFLFFGGGKTELMRLCTKAAHGAPSGSAPQREGGCPQFRAMSVERWACAAATRGGVQHRASGITASAHDGPAPKASDASASRCPCPLPLRLPARAG